MSNDWLERAKQVLGDDPEPNESLRMLRISLVALALLEVYHEGRMKGIEDLSERHNARLANLSSEEEVDR